MDDNYNYNKRLCYKSISDNRKQMIFFSHIFTTHTAERIGKF